MNRATRSSTRTGKAKASFCSTNPPGHCPPERLVFYCRTISASTAPLTPRRTCCPYTHVLIIALRVSRSCELFPARLYQSCFEMVRSWMALKLTGAVPDSPKTTRGSLDNILDTPLLVVRLSGTPPIILKHPSRSGPFCSEPPPTLLHKFQKELQI